MCVCIYLPEKSTPGLFHVTVGICSVCQRRPDKISTYALAAVIDTVQFMKSVKFVVKTRTLTVMEKFHKRLFCRIPPMFGNQINRSAQLSVWCLRTKSKEDL